MCQYSRHSLFESVNCGVENGRELTFDEATNYVQGDNHAR